MANNLKALKNRIKSVSSTEKVTQAMKMITTSKFANSNSRLNKLRSYFETNSTVLEMMFKAFAKEEIDFAGNALARSIYGQSSNADTIILVSISSDKGLCGAFNYNINKQLELEIEECKKLGKEYKILPIGKRSREYVKNNHEEHYLDKCQDFAMDIKSISPTSINEVKAYLKSVLLQSNIHSARVIYTNYVSSFVQDVKVSNILPCFEIKDSKESQQESEVETDIKASLSLERVFDDYLMHVLHKFLLNSLNSEYAVRMITMDNASTNAEELIKKLTLEVNRTRQANVTSELVEIISGAEAV